MRIILFFMLALGLPFFVKKEKIEEPPLQTENQKPIDTSQLDTKISAALYVLQ